MVPKDDWRRMGQEDYLTGAALRYISPYVPPRPGWDHEHCAFCLEKISPYEGDLPGGYCTPDRSHWICPSCFQDFREEFLWTVEE